jgi:hypothetical protein
MESVLLRAAEKNRSWMLGDGVAENGSCLRNKREKNWIKTINEKKNTAEQNWRNSIAAWKYSWTSETSNQLSITKFSLFFFGNRKVFGAQSDEQT